jgi:hypothetical protein
VDKASREQQLHAIRLEIGVQRDLVFRVKLTLQLHAVSALPADLDTVYRTIERIRDKQEKDEVLEDLVTALIAMGRYRQADVRAREIRSAPRRGRLLNCIRAAEANVVTQRRAQEAMARVAASQEHLEKQRQSRGNFVVTEVLAGA